MKTSLHAGKWRLCAHRRSSRRYCPLARRLLARWSDMRARRFGRLPRQGPAPVGRVAPNHARPVRTGTEARLRPSQGRLVVALDYDRKDLPQVIPLS